MAGMCLAMTTDTLAAFLIACSVLFLVILLARGPR